MVHSNWNLSEETSLHSVACLTCYYDIFNLCFNENLTVIIRFYCPALTKDRQRPISYHLVLQLQLKKKHNFVNERSINPLSQTAHNLQVNHCLRSSRVCKLHCKAIGYGHLSLCPNPQRERCGWQVDWNHVPEAQKRNEISLVYLARGGQAEALS